MPKLMLYQTRKGQPVRLIAEHEHHDDWMVKLPASEMWVETSRRKDGTAPNDPDLDIIPVEPSPFERELLLVLAVLFGLPPSTFRDQLIITVLREGV